ncbi:MAG TPA: ABC transporter substrate-binding protein, partial [Bacillota bacterium]|nr:ABC transporter substrate-binding protein [Bacillota bacterium]
MFKKALCLWLILIVVLSTAACAPKGGDTKKTNDTNASGSDAQAPDSLKTFVTNLSADPTTFNPVFKADDDGHLIYQNVFDGLLELNFNSEVIPGLAETWEASEDGKTYTFHLAKGIKWHDGVAFSSDDVKYTYERIMTDHGFIGETLSHALESIECPDPDTVVLKLKEPDATLLGTLAWYEHFIIPKHIYEKEADWATAEAATVKPIGTGPFKFVSHKKGESITLEANDEYFKGRPLIDRLVYTIIPDANTATMAFRNGEIDLLCGVPTA